MVFQASHRRLAGSMFYIRYRQAFTGKFVNWVMPQLVTIVRIFVAANHRIHPLTHYLRQAVSNFVRVSPLLNAVGGGLTHLHLLLGLSSQQNPGIRTQFQVGKANHQ
jgi:hypothetical protein